VAGPQGIQGIQGTAGTSVKLLAPVADAASLPATGNTAGDGRLTLDNGHLHYWNGTAWQDNGLVRGPKGDQGAPGTPGVQGPAGAQGLAGVKGDQGDPTIINGTSPIAASTVGNTATISVSDATATTKGVVQLADAAAITAGTAGRVVDAAQLKAAAPADASTTVKGVVQLADAAAITAGTAGLVVDAAQLKAAAPPDATTAVKGVDTQKWKITTGVLSPADATNDVLIDKLAGTAGANVIVNKDGKLLRRQAIIHSAVAPTMTSHPDLIHGSIWVDTSQNPPVMHLWDTMANAGAGGWEELSSVPKPINPAPSDFAANPAFDSGTGTQADPFIITPSTVAAPGGTVQSAQQLTLNGQKAGAAINWTDNSVGAGNRFQQSGGVVPASGTVNLRLSYLDTPNSTASQNYTGNLQLGTTYFRWVVTQQASRAPDVGTVTLADVAGGSRFTSVSFPVSATMTDDGLPTSTKKLKAYVEGTLKASAMTGAIVSVGNQATPAVIGTVTTKNISPLTGNTQDIFDTSDTSGFGGTVASGASGEVTITFPAPITVTSLRILGYCRNGGTLPYSTSFKFNGGAEIKPPTNVTTIYGGRIDWIDFTPLLTLPIQVTTIKHILTVPNGTTEEYKMNAVEINGKRLVGGQAGKLLTFADASTFASFSPDEAVTESGGGDDATGTIDTIDAAAKTILLRDVTGTWDTGSAVKGQPKTTANTKLYCKLNAAGAVSDLQSADPGFTAWTPAGTGPYTGTVTFPALLPTGAAPDTDLPAGTSITVEVEASNTSGSDSAKSNTVTPA
jgi:hypothetical protein